MHLALLPPILINDWRSTTYTFILRLDLPRNDVDISSNYYVSFAGQTGEHVSSRYLATAAPFEVILSKSVLSVSEGGAGAEYNVVLDRDPGSTVVVSVTPTDSQVTASPSKFNFTTANWNEQQRVTAGAVNDSVVEGLVESILSHKVQILDSNVTWTGGFSPSENISVRVYDDDQAGVVISSSSLYIKEGDVVAYTARLMGSPSSNVEVRRWP